MDMYVTGAAVKALREEKGLTQAALADRLGVSGKAVSKWETSRGLPDITLLEPLAAALGVSVCELLSGGRVANRNVSGNMKRSRFFVCPVCGNVIHSLGEAVISCCGITLPPLEAEPADAAHVVSVTPVEDEYYVTADHEMTKSHYISFIACLTSDRLELVKLYPEGGASARFKRAGQGSLYLMCNRHGLMKIAF